MAKKISSIRIVDNSALFKKASQEAIYRGLFKIGLIAERAAKEIATEKGVVDTGLLRNSITFAMGGEKPAITSYQANKGGKTGSYSGVAPEKKIPTVYVGTNVEYAAINEVGGRGHRARPFLKPAIEDFKNDYKQILKEELEKG